MFTTTTTRRTTTTTADHARRLRAASETLSTTVTRMSACLYSESQSRLIFTDDKRMVKTWSLVYIGIVSNGNAWERRSQSYFDSGNGVFQERNSPLVIRYTCVNMSRLFPQQWIDVLSTFVLESGMMSCCAWRCRRRCMYVWAKFAIRYASYKKCKLSNSAKSGQFKQNRRPLLASDGSTNCYCWHFDLPLYLLRHLNQL